MKKIIIFSSFEINGFVLTDNLAKRFEIFIMNLFFVILKFQRFCHLVLLTSFEAFYKYLDESQRALYLFTVPSYMYSVNKIKITVSPEVERWYTDYMSL